MAAYTFTKELHISVAFTDYLQKTYGDLYDLWENVPPFDQPLVRIHFTRELTQEEQDLLASRINSYVSPSYWLNLDHTENQFLTSLPSNNTTVSAVQSFIVSPYNTADYVMGDLKTIIKYETPDISVFNDWDPEQTPITCTVELYDYTQQQTIYNTVENINNIITGWKQNNSTEPYWKTVQIYGLKDANPGSDAIWQIKLAVSDPRVYISLNGMQKIFYTVDTWS